METNKEEMIKTDSGITESDVFKLELAKDLSKIDFDFDKYVPVLVQFSSHLENNTTNDLGLTKYLYAAPIEMDIKTGDLSIVELNNNLNIVKVCKSYNNIVDQTFVRAAKRVVSEINGSNRKIKEIKSIAFNLGNKDGEKLKPYFDNIERNKKKIKIMENLEAEAAKAQKLMMYQSLAKDNPEIAKLLKELEEVETK